MAAQNSSIPREAFCGAGTVTRLLAPGIAAWMERPWCFSSSLPNLGLAVLGDLDYHMSCLQIHLFSENSLPIHFLLIRNF